MKTKRTAHRRRRGLKTVRGFSRSSSVIQSKTRPAKRKRRQTVNYARNNRKTHHNNTRRRRAKRRGRITHLGQ